ncbi:MAG: hypothetical protein WAO71_07310 [Gallionella sp.]
MFSAPLLYADCHESQLAERSTYKVDSPSGNPPFLHLPFGDLLRESTLLNHAKMPPSLLLVASR